MSCQPFNELSEQARNQLACNLAALILHDEHSDITNENISKVVKASGVNVPGYWPMLVAKALEGQNFSDLLRVTGGGSSSNAPAQQGTTTGTSKPVVEEKKESVKEESEDMDMGDLFG
jgi:large subunit ribosomal protein LP1